MVLYSTRFLTFYNTFEIFAHIVFLIKAKQYKRHEMEVLMIYTVRRDKIENKIIRFSDMARVMLCKRNNREPLFVCSTANIAALSE